MDAIDGLALAGSGLRAEGLSPDSLRVGPASPAGHYAARALPAPIRLAPAADKLSFAGAGQRGQLSEWPAG
jgi:hypothetical protein